MRAVNAINMLEVILVVALLFQLLVNHGSAALPCKRFVNKRLNDSCIHHRRFPKNLAEIN